LPPAPAPEKNPDPGQTGITVNPPLTTSAEWIGAIHDQQSEERVLETLLLAVLVGGGNGVDSVYLLRPQDEGAVLAGRLGAKREELERALPEGAVASELTGALLGVGVEVLAPATTGMVRCLRFPMEQTADASVACYLSDRPCELESGKPGTSPLWAVRLSVASATALPIRVGGESCAVLVAAAGKPGTLQNGAGRETDFLVTQAEHALERIRAQRAARVASSRLATTRDVARSLLRMQSLSTELGRLLTATCQTLEARGGCLWLVDADTKGLYLAKTYAAGAVEDERALANGLRRLAEDVTWRRETPLIGDACQDGRIGEVAGDLGSIVAVPLVVLDQPRGALILFGKEGGLDDAPAVFANEDKELLAHFGALTAVVTELSQLTGQASDSERKLSDVRQERNRLRTIADLGEISVKLAQEMAKPVSSIVGFARRVQRTMEEDDANREYLQIVVREGERLERLVQEHLQFAALNRTRLGMKNVNHLLQTLLEKLAPEIEQRRIRLLKKLPKDVPALLLDEDKVTQAFENILRSAIEGVATGGRVLVQTRQSQDHVVVEVCHDGPPIRGDVLEHLFVPFGTGGRAGVGLGLAVAQRVVQDHGGEIAVQARGDWGHIVALSLPVQDNADRRRRMDRRGTGRDRRDRFPLG
jgi:signal transduction histidine kinase